MNTSLCNSRCLELWEIEILAKDAAFRYGLGMPRAEIRVRASTSVV